MKLQGQSIRLFIIESLKKLKVAELSNWTGKAYIGERKHSQLIQKLDDLQGGTGIYFLLSNSEEESKLYIGEADDVASRIDQHHRNLWWDKFIVFVSKDANLTKAHVRYLEKELYILAKENLGTITLENAVSPPGSNLPDYDIADMDIFLENIIFVLNNLGIIDFAKTKEIQEIPVEQDSIFYLNLKKENKDKKAMLAIKDDSYVLLKNSYLEKEPTESGKKTFGWKKWNELLENKKIKEEDGVMLVLEDIYFKSPSGAASTVCLTSIDGRANWRLKTGKTLDEFESEEV